MATIHLLTTHIEIGTVHHHPPLARRLMHMHMLAARQVYHRTDFSGVGPEWLQYCGPPVTVYTAIGGEESFCEQALSVSRVTPLNLGRDLQHSNVLRITPGPVSYIYFQMRSHSFIHSFMCIHG